MKPTNKPLLRYNQRQQLKEQRVGHDKQYRDPMCDDKGAQLRSIRNIDKMLIDQSPEPLTGQEKDKIDKRIKELEQEVSASMLPVETMRRCPSGAPHEHLKREMAMKAKMLELKNLYIQREPDSDDPNLANLERLRPERGAEGTSGFVMGAVMQGHMAMSPRAKANWPLGEPTADTALKQARRAAAEQKGNGKHKRNLTPEQRVEIGQRLKAGRAAKRPQAEAVAV